MLRYGPLLVVLSAVPSLSRAQEPSTPAADSADFPARVARLSLIDGAVAFLAAEDSAWTAAEPNRPVTTGDRLWADTAARAELDLGAAVVRLGPSTELDVVRLGDRTFQVRLPQGSIIERVRAMEEAQYYEIDVPNAALALQSAGTYRVDVSPDGMTATLTVWGGNAEVVAAGSAFDVHEGQTVTIRGDGTVTFALNDAAPPDDFDRWSRARDARWDGASSRQYVSAGIAGAEDLDAYGQWETDAVYGRIWFPRVVVGWAPYRHGHWVWMGRWGWTWIDDAPWGWAPFHYGRWVHVRSAWAWCPGVIVTTPVYAPALVVFIGASTWGPSVYFGAGGGIAWFPLGPDEAYWPPYIASVTYVRLVNRSSVRQYAGLQRRPAPPSVRYRNRSVPGSVTAIPWRRFAGAAPIGGAAVSVPEGVLATAPVVGSSAPIAPTRQSLTGRREPPAGLRRVPALPPARLATRPTQALRAPPPAAVPFRAQVGALERNDGRPLSREQVRVLRPAAVPRRPAVALPARPAAAPPTRERKLVPAVPGKVPPPTPRPAIPSPVPTTVPRAPNPPARAGLDDAFRAARESLDQRQRREYARPSAGESASRLSTRQQVERRELQTRYQDAQAEGKKTLPPPKSAPPRKAAPTKRP